MSMSGGYPWIYNDSKGNKWMFSKNSNKELCYRIMYREGEWVKEILIDRQVIGFTIYVDEDEIIHVVYSNTEGELKYCTMKDKKWIGKTLCQVESDKFEIQNIKVEIIKGDMHIFYLQVSKDGSDHGILMHCIWNGKETKVTEVQDIILIDILKECYLVEVNEKSGIDMFFITDEGYDKSLNQCSFENNRWTPIKRIYGIQGDNIGFEVLMDREEIHILNKYREGKIYFLEHVCIDIVGNIKVFRVNESRKEFIEPLLFTKSNKLYSCWLEQGNIYYSNFDGEKWGSSIYINKGNELTFERYNYFSYIDGENFIKSRKIYGTNGLDLYLFNPSEFIVYEKDSLNGGVNKYNEMDPQEELLENFKLELFRVKSEKKNMEKKVNYLSTQLQRNKRFIEDYEDRIVRTLEQKRKSDENCNVFMELHKNIQKEFEVTKKKVLEEETIKADLQRKLKEIEEQVLEKNVTIESHQKELEDIKQKLIEERNIKATIESKLQEYEQENRMIRQELELEKNQSIMERLLKRSPRGV